MAKFDKGNTGRPKGAKNKLTKTVKECWLEAFNELQNDSKANLIDWGRKNPGYFYQIAAKLIPAAVDVTTGGEPIKQIFKIGNTEIEL